MARQPTKYTSFISHLPASIDTISRRLILVLLAVFTAVVLLLVQSTLWSNAVTVWMRVIIVMTALVAYFRPHYGLLIVAALAPVSQVISRLVDSQLRAPEALVLAFLAGTLVRGWTLQELRRFRGTRLELVALIFALLVAASCVEQLWVLQIRSDFVGPFLLSVLDYSVNGYLSSLRGFGMVFHALLLLEGAALLVFASYFCRERAGFAGRLAVALAIGAVGASVVNIWYFGRHATQTADSAGSVLQLLGQRWTAYVADINAAGSFFAMTMLLAIGFGLFKRSRRVAWLLTAIPLGVALWLTASRTAIAAVAATTASVTGVVMLKKLRSRSAAFVISVACILALAATIWRFFPAPFTDSTASTAIVIRRLFLQTTARMLQAEPLFGVGIGQYPRWSSEYGPPELFKFYSSENAHNNFAQIAGELGVIGLIAFVAVLAVALSTGKRLATADPMAVPVISAIAAFMLTWLGGHPLLVPEVSYPFWLLLGLGSALLAADSNARSISAVAGIAFVLLLTSMPLRVSHKTADLDMTRIRYGISEKGLMGSRGRLFVPADKAYIELPVRSRIATQQSPTKVDVLIDHRIVDTITMVDDRWLTRRIQLPGGRRHFQAIDLQLRGPHLRDEDEAAARRSVEIGNWNIISKPHG
jgi:O-antigen ligase